jgi:hypothetical protein
MAIDAVLSINDPRPERRRVAFAIYDPTGQTPQPNLAGTTVYKSPNFATKVALDTTGGTGVLVASDGGTGTDGLYYVQLSTVDMAGRFPGERWRLVVNGSGTVGQEVREVEFDINPWLYEGTVASGAVGSITFGADAPSVTGALAGGRVFIYAGTGANQPPRDLDSYDGPTRTGIPTVNFNPAPAADSKVVVDLGGVAPNIGTSVLNAALNASYANGTLGEKIYRLAVDTTGQVSVGALAAGIITAIATAVNGVSNLTTLVGRLTQGIADKLTSWVVNGSGQVTTSNPGGLDAGQVTLLNTAATQATTAATNAANAATQSNTNGTNILSQLDIKTSDVVSQLLVGLRGNESWRDPVAMAQPGRTDVTVEIVDGGVVVGHRVMSYSSSGKLIGVADLTA